ncbi:hypothetical protein M8J76_008405 [Diaphorina citri]|nr:hypothetical protein M8J75_005045 [Diaphorina citri]KAI5736913.1 hypothetical protein M8J76_008405 [Diaphorina citri]
MVTLTYSSPLGVVITKCLSIDFNCSCICIPPVFKHSPSEAEAASNPFVTRVQHYPEEISCRQYWQQSFVVIRNIYDENSNFKNVTFANVISKIKIDEKTRDEERNYQEKEGKEEWMNTRK